MSQDAFGPARTTPERSIDESRPISGLDIHRMTVLCSFHFVLRHNRQTALGGHMGRHAPYQP
jgi:hypothetical protein